MPEYELAAAADGDLQEIALYTIETWGAEQAERYEAALEKHFAAIARGEVPSRVVLDHRPELRFSRCEHHGSSTFSETTPAHSSLRSSTGKWT